MSFMNKSYKLVKILLKGNMLWLKALKLGVAAGIEHLPVLNLLDCKTVVDVGSNRGQFALVAKFCFPKAKIISFEPLLKPSELFSKIFFSDKNVTLYNAAIGSENTSHKMYVSAHDDSSSLLPISSLQRRIFPGTEEVDIVTVQVAPMDFFLNKNDIVAPAILKLDVQGYELEVLEGCSVVLNEFTYIYVECSFVELYEGQAFASEVIDFLYKKYFSLDGVYNMYYDDNGRAIQADFLFKKANAR